MSLDPYKLAARNLRLAQKVEALREERHHLFDTLDMVLGVGRLLIEDFNDENSRSVFKVAVKVGSQRLHDAVRNAR